MAETIESLSFGDLRVELRRPESRLSELAPKIREVLGHDLPEELAAFYAEGDGLHYRATLRGAVVGMEASIYGLEEAFAGFRPHRQYRSVKAYEKDVEEGDLYDQPFCEETWSDGFEVETKKDLLRLNTLKRSKVLVSVPGESAWVTIDFADPDGAPYRLGLARDGYDLYPLALSFTDFVQHFRRFGAAHFFMAYVGKKAEKAMNVDIAEHVSQSLKDYAGAFPEDVKRLIARAKKGA